MAEKGRVCVTGAGGFIASWLVKVLLSKGYVVHGTVRDPSDAKNAHLKKLENAEENLHLFKADLLEYDSMCTAIAGCEGVFHVASPVDMGKLQNPEVEVITPAVTGTLNVLKASDEAKIKRVVVVSSIAAIVLNANWPQDRPMDEDCWSEHELCKITENWYCLAKTMAEREALDFGERTGLNIVTICPSLAIGPCLQSKLNYSSSFLLDLFKETEEPMESRVWYFVDVRDVIEAMLLIYLNPAATGRYICTTQAIRISDLVEKLKHMYPNYSYTKNFIEIDQEQELSSEKMQRLGWRPRRFEGSLVDAVDYFKEVGFLSKD